MNGETTIPNYGKNDEESLKYLIAPCISVAFAEFMLDRIKSLNTYKQNLDLQGKKSKKYVLSTDAIFKITKRVTKIADLIGKDRVRIDKIYENSCKLGIDDKDGKVKALYEQELSDLLNRLDKCIAILSQVSNE